MLYSEDIWEIAFIYNEIDQKGLFSHDVVIVSAYFPLNKSKHLKSEYVIWIRSFLRIINCKTIIYTTNTFYEQFYRKEASKLFKGRQKLFNFNCSFNDIYDVPIMRNLSNAYKQMHKIDPEKSHHYPELYAIWNSKIYFLRESTLIYPNETFYFWVDSGSVRDQFFSNLFDSFGIRCDKPTDEMKCTYVSFPSNYFTEKILQYNNPPLEICIFFVNPFILTKYNSKRTVNNIIEGTSFFGSKKGIHKFYEAFWEVHNSWLDKHIFCGKDQQIYDNVLANYFNKINFYVFPAYRAKNAKVDKWFAFWSAFSNYNPYYIPDKLLLPSYFLDNKISALYRNLILKYKYLLLY